MMTVSLDKTPPRRLKSPSPPRPYDDLLAPLAMLAIPVPPGLVLLLVLYWQAVPR